MNASKHIKGSLSEINVVPLVDVMLVLLIIFMITAPMMQQGLSDRPAEGHGKAPPSKEDIQVLTITKDKG